MRYYLMLLLVLALSACSQDDAATSKTAGQSAKPANKTILVQPPPGVQTPMGYTPVVTR